MEKEPKRYYLEGNTYPIREELKSRGFQWDPEANQWYHTKRGVAQQAQQLVPPVPQKHYIEGAEFSDREQLKELGARWDPGSSRWYHADPEIARQAQSFVDAAHHKYFLEGDTGQVFAVKEKLKELGAQWDPDSKKWYHTDRLKAAEAQSVIEKGPDRHYIEGATYSQREMLKELGAEWDAQRSQWYHTNPQAATKAQELINEANEKATQKHYVTDAPRELSQDLKQLGLRWDPEVKQWYHGNRETATQAQELVNSKKPLSEPELKVQGSQLNHSL